MSRALARILPRVLRNDLWETPSSRFVSPWGGSSWSGMDYFDREFRRMQNMINRMEQEMFTNTDSQFFSNRSRDPTSSLFRLVEEDGKRKVRVQFDAEKMKPEDIQVKTQGNMLEIRAKQEDNSDYHSVYQEYCRRLTLPEGVKPEELSCKFEDGVVTLEAPYTPPAVEAGEKAAPAKLEGPQEIRITHEKPESGEQGQQQMRQEVPVERGKENDRQGGQERQRVKQ